MTRALRLLRRLSAEGGYTLTELLTVLAILAAVVTPVVVLFTAGSKAEIDMNERFQAQQNARLALSKMRRDVHCASSATIAATASGSSVTLAVPPTGVGGCGTTTVTWCTVEVSAGRFALFRTSGSTCGTGGVRFADYLTGGNAFTYTPRSATSLATLAVDFPVDADPKDARAAYRLQDTLAIRRSGRA